MKKVTIFLLGLLDEIHDFLINWGIRILLVLFIGVVIHNVLKIGDITGSYSGKYRNMVIVENENNRMMNVYQVGSGNKTIVILPGFGSQSPILQYKALADALKDQYKVVIIEYLGYGYSMGTKAERNSANIASNIVTALNRADVSGPFILMPHSISNMYAMKMQKLYPSLVQGIISLDGIYPYEITDDFYLKQNQNTVTNVNITSIFEYTGFARVLSYVRPSVFYIDKMKEMTNVYTKEDISAYRNRIGSSYLTRTMVREINKLEDNMNDVKDYVYPDYLPVLSILSKDLVNEYELNKNKGAKMDLKELANRMITNSSIQKIVEIEGNHDLQFTNPKGVVNEVKAFLERF